MRFLPPLLGLTALLIVCSAAFSATTLHYQAYVAGIQVGEASVELHRTDTDYLIEGHASAEGVAHLFSDWSSEFYARGHIVHNTPVLIEYGYEEKERHKHRILKLQDGMIIEIKNGKPRKSRPAFDGLDPLTAFFIDPACWTSQLLHTGRTRYEATGHPSSRLGGCLLQVEDAAGDRDRVHLIFGERNGFQVPVKLTTRGLLRGSIVLKDSAADSPVTTSQNISLRKFSMASELRRSALSE